MFKKNCLIIISSFCLFLQSSGFALIENSVVPTVAKYENVERLPKDKIADDQFYEIFAAFDHRYAKMRIVTYNLLCDDREEKSEEINKWHNRIPRIVELLSEMQPDIICVQEQYQRQLDVLLPLLGDEYSFYGSPRSDGEVNGIIYRNDRFQLIEGSVTTIPPKYHRKTNTLTMTQLKDVKTGQSFAVFNIHLCFSSNNQRGFEAEQIIKQMTEVAQHMPVMLAGDLNLFPFHLENSFPYFDGQHVHRILTKSGLLKDSQEIALLGHVGPLSTFTCLPDGDGTPFKGLGTPGVMLDRLYVSQGIEVLIHAVQPGTVDGCFPSDHMPVFVDFIVPQNNSYP